MSTYLNLSGVESAFQKLHFQLSLTISPRLKVRLLGDFCEILLHRHHLENNHSYYQEILPDLIAHLNRENLEYQPLGLLQTLFKTLTYIDNSSDFSKSGEGFKNAFGAIRYQTAATACHVREWSAGLQVVLTGKDIKLDPDTLHEINDLSQLLHIPWVQQLPEAQYQLLERIQNEWFGKTQGYHDHEVWIPLVEKLELSTDEVLIVGTLNPLHLELEARRYDRHQDLIFFNNHPIGSNDLVNYQAQDAIRAARNQHNFLKQSKTNRYSVMFGFPVSDYFYSGSSFGFAMSLLTLCSLEHQANLRRQHALSKDIAITGGVDLQGEIRPVNEASLREKISAVFFSPLKTLVLPIENVAFGQELLNRLLQNYPNKELTLEGVGSIGSVLQKEALIHHQKMPLMRWMKNHLTRSKVIQALTALILTVIIVGSILHYYFDPNPVKFEQAGQTLRFYNKNGTFLWNLDLGFAPEFGATLTSGESRFSPIQINDYDGDGENEVILGTRVKNHENGGRLYFIETDGSIKWEYGDHPKLKFGGDEYSDTYAVSFLYPYKHKNSDTYDFYVGFSHRPWFPNQMLRFNSDGQVLNTFIHPGSIYDIELFDLNGDDEVELLLGCTNNRFNTAVLCILPSRNFSGSVPGEADDSCVLDGGAVDPALIYLRFPQWGQYDFTDSQARSCVNDIYLDEAKGFGLTTSLGNTNRPGSFIYHFNFGLQLEYLSVTDGFLSTYRMGHKQSFFQAYDQEKWTQDMSAIQLWQNGTWRPLIK